MEQLLIPRERARLLDGRKLGELERRLGCKVEVRDANMVVITGEPYDEYNAKNVVQAFGRGFGIGSACRLLTEQYFFKYIDLRDAFRNSAQIKRLKARIIGEEGRCKEYIQSVSGAELSIYGDTIGMIGTVEGIGIATIGIQALLEGSTHKSAYRLMELARRRSERDGREER